jgi:hypothetical protein
VEGLVADCLVVGLVAERLVAVCLVAGLVAVAEVRLVGTIVAYV